MKQRLRHPTDPRWLDGENSRRPSQAGHLRPPSSNLAIQRTTNVVQRVLDFPEALRRLDPAQNPAIDNPEYRRMVERARRSNARISVTHNPELPFTARYTGYGSDFPNGELEVGALAPEGDQATFRRNLATVGHEIQHALDFAQRQGRRAPEGYSGDWSKNVKIWRELRGFAIEAAISKIELDKGRGVPQMNQLLVGDFASERDLLNAQGQVVRRLVHYFREFEIDPSADATTVIEFLQRHPSWVADALELFRDALPKHDRDQGASPQRNESGDEDDDKPPAKKRAVSKVSDTTPASSTTAPVPNPTTDPGPAD